MYPGLIELHNHMAFDILRLWQVPRPFTNRDKWRADSVPDYRRLISGPMTVLGKSDVVAAIVRYVEAKCLLGGTTTGQGVRLNSAPGIVELLPWRGAQRRVPGRRAALGRDARPGRRRARRGPLQATARRRRPACCCTSPRASTTQRGAPSPPCATRTATVTRTSAGRSRRRWPASTAPRCRARTSRCWPGSAGRWCGRRSRTICSTAARPTWRPRPRRRKKLRIGLGADWSPSGSKNLLGELKVAKLCSDEHARATGDPLLHGRRARRAGDPQRRGHPRLARPARRDRRRAPRPT